MSDEIDNGLASPEASDGHIWDRSALDIVNQIWAIPADWHPTRRKAHAQVLITEALKAAAAR